MNRDEGIQTISSNIGPPIKEADDKQLLGVRSSVDMLRVCNKFMEWEDH